MLIGVVCDTNSAVAKQVQGDEMLELSVVIHVSCSTAGNNGPPCIIYQTMNAVSQRQRQVQCVLLKAKVRCHDRRMFAAPERPLFPRDF